MKLLDRVKKFLKTEWKYAAISKANSTHPTYRISYKTWYFPFWQTYFESHSEFFTKLVFQEAKGEKDAPLQS